MAKRTTRKKTAKKKTTRKKATSRTAARKKTTRKKAAKKTAKKAAKRTSTRKPAIATVDKPRTKSQVISTISEQTELSRKEVQAVFDAMTAIMAKDLKGKPGIFNVPGLMKVERKHKKRVPRRFGVNPFTGQEQWFDAKPARNIVKVRPLKALKDLV